jgi:hypothetical protein
MAQAMYKHEALLNLIWCVADADKSESDEWVGEVSNAEYEYFEAIKAKATKKPKEFTSRNPFNFTPNKSSIK